MSKKDEISLGFGKTGVLTIIFVILKLTGAIDWSWWWVLLPTLINIGAVTLFYVSLLIYLTHDDKKFNDTLKKGK